MQWSLAGVETVEPWCPRPAWDICKSEAERASKLSLVSQHKVSKLVHSQVRRGYYSSPQSQDIKLALWIPCAKPSLLTVEVTVSYLIDTQITGKLWSLLNDIRLLRGDLKFMCLKCIIVMMSFCSVKYDSLLRKVKFLDWLVTTTALSDYGENSPSMNGEYEWFI